MEKSQERGEKIASMRVLNNVRLLADLKRLSMFETFPESPSDEENTSLKETFKGRVADLTFTSERAASNNVKAVVESLLGKQMNHGPETLEAMEASFDRLLD